MKHLLSIEDLSRSELDELLDLAASFLSVTQRETPKVPALRGRTVVSLFFEDSTRTRISFEVAAKRLSADVINFAAKGSSISKGESLKDTALTLEAMGADAVSIGTGALVALACIAEPSLAESLFTTVLVTVWGVRLAVYLAWRNHGKGEDFRYRAMRKQWGARFPLVSLVTVFALQGTLMWIVSLGVQTAQGRHTALGVLAYIGIAVWLVGLLCQQLPRL